MTSVVGLNSIAYYIDLARGTCLTDNNLAFVAIKIILKKVLKYSQKSSVAHTTFKQHMTKYFCDLKKYSFLFYNLVYKLGKNIFND